MVGRIAVGNVRCHGEFYDTLGSTDCPPAGLTRCDKFFLALPSNGNVILSVAKDLRYPGLCQILRCAQNDRDSALPTELATPG